MKADVTSHERPLWRRRRAGWLARALALWALYLPPEAAAQTLEPPFDQAYTLVDLGTVPDVPPGYGAISSVFPVDPSFFIIAGAADTPAGKLFANQPARDAAGHIASYNIRTLPYVPAPGVDAGLAHGPGPTTHVLFYTSQANEIGQATAARGRKVVSLAPFLSSPLAGVAFVPPSLAAARQLKFVTRGDARWGTLEIAADGTGTYDVVGATLGASLGGDPGGFTYVVQEWPAFPGPSIVMTDRSAKTLVAYEVDENGDAIPETRRDVVTGLDDPVGVATDQPTGDFLVTERAGRVILVRRVPVPPPTPTPTLTPTPTPTAIPTSTPTSAVAECAPAPLGSCAVPGKARIVLQGKAGDPRKERILWRWAKASASSSDFGDPVGGGANYRLCVYDDDTLRLGLAVAAGGTCDGKPCWKATRTGPKYRSKKGNGDGIAQLTLRPGVGKASITLYGKGPRLDSPFPITGTTSVTVQLVKNPGAGPQCWGVTFPAPAKTSGGPKLKFVDKVP